VLLFWVLLQALGAIIRWSDAYTPVSYWAHLGGFLTGALLNFAFRAPDLAQAAVDRELLDAARLEGPAKTARVAREHLVRHPRDLSALHDLADALTDLEEHDEEIRVRLKIVELTQGVDWIPQVVRLHQLDALSRLNEERRLSIAREVVIESEGAAALLYESIGFGPASMAAPEALFELADLCKGRDEARAAKALEKLTEYPRSSPYVLAKARGWLS
jgi:hypothetical protein